MIGVILVLIHIIRGIFENINLIRDIFDKLNKASVIDHIWGHASLDKETLNSKTEVASGCLGTVGKSEKGILTL
jgi:hypothetical protein